MTTAKKRGVMVAVLCFILALSAILLFGCGGDSNFSVYNTKDMTDEESTSYFSESVLQDVKDDVRNRTIVIYEIEDDVAEDVELQWSLSDENGEVLNSAAETGIYVDEDAPESETRIVKIMIGWDEADLDKEWSVSIYYFDADEAKVELGTVSFDVNSADYVK